jgi:tetratricopeptide (TPR) repeat protein
MPYELQDYTTEEAGLKMLIRVGGDLETIKHIIAAGFPVIVEKGPTFRDINYNVTWMGHYQVLSGYNDAEGYFIAQDSYIEPDYIQPYKTLLSEWRSFNYLYMVVYPENKENDVLNLLGSNRDIHQNYLNALDKAQEEIYKTSGVDQFFAMFNYGTNLVQLRDYNGAASAYDQAFAMYDALPDDSTIPYRILWYETGPFLAYYYTGRYNDVVEKATKNSIEMVRDDEPALEESFYWRGMAEIAMGRKDDGVDDFYTCLNYHQDFQPCMDALHSLGIYP